MPAEKELRCSGCQVEAAPRRLDVGVRGDLLVYVCPVCGADMGEVPQ